MAHQAFGIQSELPVVETIALGADEVTPMEMAVAFSVFQSGGDRIEPFGVVRVVGADGTAIRVNGPNFQRRQLSTTSAEGIDSCLRAVVTSGTGRAAGSVTNARGKTGTTSDNKDAWFCGYTDKYIGVGWVANEVKDSNGRTRYLPMNSYVMGGHVVAPMWASIVGHAQDVHGEDSRRISGGSHETVVKDEEPTPVEENAGTEIPVDVTTEVPSDASPDIPENNGDPTIDPGNPVIKKDNKPDAPRVAPGDDGGHVTFVEICSDTGMRASIYCPERVRKAFKVGKEPKSRCTAHRSPGG